MVVVILMGVCGCGKTTVGEELATRLDWPFRDADEFHSEANKLKMSASIPLTDEDRLPWLVDIHHYITSVLAKSESAVVTCSALKRLYRDILRSGQPLSSQPQPPTSASFHASSNSPDNLSSAPYSPPSQSDIVFVLLTGTREVLEARLAGRHGHFMPADLLTSQLNTLEEPGQDENCLVVDIDADVNCIVDAVVGRLGVH